MCWSLSLLVPARKLHNFHICLNLLPQGCVCGKATNAGTPHPTPLTYPIFGTIQQVSCHLLGEILPGRKLSNESRWLRAKPTAGNRALSRVCWICTEEEYLRVRCSRSQLSRQPLFQELATSWCNGTGWYWGIWHGQVQCLTLWESGPENDPWLRPEVPGSAENEVVMLLQQMFSFLFSVSLTECHKSRHPTTRLPNRWVCCNGQKRRWSGRRQQRARHISYVPICIVGYSSVSCVNIRYLWNQVQCGQGELPVSILLDWAAN